MNEINLKGTIQNIKYSHTVGETVFDESTLVTVDNNYIKIKFKSVNNTHKNGDEVNLLGALRSYSKSDNKVQLYVLTEFDEGSEQEANHAVLDGRICKKLNLGKTKSNVPFYKFILANNIITKDKKFNSYIPCVVYGAKGARISNLAVSTKLNLTGHIKSRQIDDTYVYEFVVDSYEVLE